MTPPRALASWSLGLTLVVAACAGPSPIASPPSAAPCPGGALVCTAPGAGRLALVAGGQPAALYADGDDDAGVLRAVRNLQADLARVAGASVGLETEALPSSGPAVLIGTLGQSALVDRLVAEGKVDTTGVSGRWEAFLQQTVERPLPGVERALVIAGSDRRGTIFGVYDLAEAIGVSPWHDWADVPVEPQADLYVSPGRRVERPAVRYRGIFLNDEEPALGTWARETYGGLNADFYESVFDLLLRSKANFLWPAMWGKSIYDDDPAAPALADEMGVVLGTSHHEPLSRAHVEWERYGSGSWNYETNADALQAFWRAGIERMGDHESLVTVGMRGDGDEAMAEGTAIDLLERIVTDQRAIIEDVTRQPAAETPQVWALYKEVQDYYDQGMEVPDDVTLLFADDNWGNIRRLPDPDAAPRAGGYGVYYHFDYVGGPRSYKWINKTQIERVWEQMHLARAHGADRLWIVNVGDLKPMEYPISFFLDYAWDPDAWPAERLPDYPRLWAAKQFGAAHADEIGRLLQAYTRFNSRRTAELLSPETYSLTDYREAERVVDAYNALLADAERIEAQLPAQSRDAYFQIVLHPIAASANLNELYVTVGRNRLYAAQGRAATNALAERARQLFARDAAITERYHALADGKWDEMMSQVHIGYTSWNDPPADVMPEVEEIEVAAGAEMGVAVEGASSWWPAADAEAVLPELSPYGPDDVYVEVFNRGAEPFAYAVETGADWLTADAPTGKVDPQTRVHLTADWAAAPAGRHRVPVTITGAGRTVTVHVPVVHPDRSDVTGFVEHDGYVSIEAPHADRAVGRGEIEWQVIPGLGRTHSAVTPLPTTADAQVPGGDSPHLAYPVFLHEAGEVEVTAILSPSFNTQSAEGLRYAVSFDDAPPQILSMHDEGSMLPDVYHADWNRMVSDNAQASTSTHTLDTAGAHVLRFWMVDPGVVLQKLVIATEALPPSYLGPPESTRVSDPTAAR